MLSTDKYSNINVTPLDCEYFNDSDVISSSSAHADRH